MHLLDGNVLIALTVEEHVHHGRATSWFGAGRPFATAPVTQGTLLRFLIREGAAATDAWAWLGLVTDHPEHTFLPDDVPFTAVRTRGVVGHRQVTDAYLADLATAHQARLATLDEGLASLRPAQVDLLD